MLELYSDLIESNEPQNDQEATLPGSDTTQHTTQTTPKSDEKTFPTTQKSDQKEEDEPLNEPQNEKYEPQNQPQEVHEPQNEPQKLLEAVKMNPKITKAALSELLGVSTSTLKRWLKANDIIWVGHSKNGYWKTPIS